MRLTDWRGNEYGVGTKVIYPAMSGRSVEIQEATVLDIWTVYQCPEDYKWKRLKEDEEVPTKEEWDWDRSVTPPVRVSHGHKPVTTEMRVRLQPDGKGSRNFHTRTDKITHWVDPEGNDIKWDDMVARIKDEHGYDIYAEQRILWSERKSLGDFGYTTRREAVKPKAVTLTLGINNITVI